jgi:hypothetical protein
MVRQTRNLFLADSTTDAHQDSLTRSYRGVVYKLFQELNKANLDLKKANAAQDAPLRLSLIGHSMDWPKRQESCDRYLDEQGLR